MTLTLTLALEHYDRHVPFFDGTVKLEDARLTAFHVGQVRSGAARACWRWGTRISGSPGPRRAARRLRQRRVEYTWQPSRDAEARDLIFATPALPFGREGRASVSRAVPHVGRAATVTRRPPLPSFRYEKKRSR